VSKYKNRETEDRTTYTEEEYKSLVRAIRRNRGFGLLFAICSPTVSTTVIERLRIDIPLLNKDDDSMAASEAVKPLKYNTLDLTGSIESLYEKIKDFPGIETVDVLFIRGLEYSIFDYEDTAYGDLKFRSHSPGYSGKWVGVPPVIARLNMQRESFSYKFSHVCFVFLVRDLTIDYLVRLAPDFYDWRNGVFEVNFKDENKNEDMFDLEEIFATGISIRRQKNSNSRNHRKRKNIISKIIVKIYRYISSYFKLIYLYIRSVILMVRGDYDRALECYDRAIEIYPEQYVFQFNRGRVLYRLGRYQEAIRSYDRAIAMEPAKSEIWYARGLVLDRVDRYEEAIESYDKAISHAKRKNDKYKSIYHRGVAGYKLTYYEQAIKDFDAILNEKIDLTTKASALHYRGLCYFELDCYEAAITSYCKSIEIQDNRPEFWDSKGLALHRLGNPEEAVRSYDRALAIDPNRQDTIYRRDLAQRSIKNK
jgi:tetratricopeptide (TPR) repeat protein